MKIFELEQTTAEPQPQQTAQAEPQPTQQDVQQVQQLLGTIDVAKEQPQSLLQKLTGWMKEYPLLDKVTDIIPQTRLVKAIARAADALEAGDGKTALNALAGAVGGNLAQAARAVNVGSALQQGDVKSAALAAGGNLATAAKTVTAAQNLAQGNTMGAVAQFAPGAARAVNTATALQQKFAPQQTAQAEPQAPQAPQSEAQDELARIRQLASIDRK